ncbi:unnamed protein product [Cylicocyclus nassatus]|uniref:Uncharacterized protein n=1 Tax=Cylicocyclus nassatus TaxID=53992 RepID=A0AA36M8W0_CYLNA|nr:unnamed protein product [Cylicocyclus nassatus]
MLGCGKAAFHGFRHSPDTENTENSERSLTSNFSEANIGAANKSGFFSQDTLTAAGICQLLFYRDVRGSSSDAEVERIMFCT